MKEIKRGEIYSADFGVGFGSEQGGVRPVLILQNNTGNKHSPTTIVAAITGRKTAWNDRVRVTKYKEINPENAEISMFSGFLLLVLTHF